MAAFETFGLPPAADPKGPKPTVGRRFFDSIQKTRGRQPLRYQFEVVPTSVAGLPTSLENVSLVWERGTKIQYTQPATVDSNFGRAIFNEVLCQSATVYKEGNRFLPKEFVFKLQVVRHQIGQEHRKTVAKVKVDLSAFCNNTTTPEHQQLTWDLKPFGSLALSLTTTWLHNITADDDQRTDGSFLTAMSGPSYDRDDANFPQFDQLSMMPDNPPSRHRRTISTGGLPSFGGLPPTTPSPPSGRPLSRTPSMDFEFSVADATKDLWGTDLKALCKADSAPVRSHKRSHSVGAKPRPSNPIQSDSPKASWLNKTSTEDEEAKEQSPHLESKIRFKNHVGKENQLTSSKGEDDQITAKPYSLKAVHSQLDTDPDHDALKPRNSHMTLRIDTVPSPKTREEAAKELLNMVSPTNPDMQTQFVEKVQQTVTTTATTVGDMFRHIMRRTGLAVPRSTAVMLDSITAETDIYRLKRLARSLLLERDEFQAKLMQNEQLSGNLQLEVDNLRNQKSALQERLEMADANISQLRDSALLRTLVDAKVQLAQADLDMNELRGVLCKERGRVRQLAARLTSTQTKLDQLANQHPTDDVRQSRGSVPVLARHSNSPLSL